MLTEAQLREFGSEGCLVVPGVIAEPLLAAADAEIDALMAESPPPAGAGGFHSYSPPPSTGNLKGLAPRRARPRSSS